MRQIKIYLSVLFVATIFSGVIAQGNLDRHAGIPSFGSSNNVAEPNLAQALEWWPDQQNIWTPIGWKDHYFRFNVLYNGSIIYDPAPGFSPRMHAKRWLGQDFLLTFHFNSDGIPSPLPARTTPIAAIDGGYGIQGWDETHVTPVLWSEFRLQEGLVIRQEVFAHIPGGQEVQTGIEPIYSWIRLHVTHVDELRHPKTYPVAIRLSRNYYIHNDSDSSRYAFSVDINPARAAYSQLLTERTTANGLRIVEPDGRIRLAMLSAGKRNVCFRSLADSTYSLQFELRAEVGDHIDLLVPMLPDAPIDLEAEARLGRNEALAQSDDFWGRRAVGTATFRVPEEYINKVIDQSVKFASVIAEKDCVSGEYSYHSGSWGYDVLWSTPTSMISHMMLDQLGYYDMTRKYSELFYRNQGTVVAPGTKLDLHPGYFSSPKTLTSIDWLTDHGAILHQICTHALLCRDSAFIAKWTKPVVKACDFLQYAAAEHDHDGVPGLLPSGVATDEEIPYQAIWNIAWNYKGLTSAVKLLNAIGHRRAGEFAALADSTKAIFTRAYREQAAKGDTWTDARGKRRFAPPTMLSSSKPPYHRFSDAFYLDTGPMVLVWAGLFDATDSLMRDAVEFFRNGPNAKLWGPRYHALHRPLLIHEISTCEPCYSWNAFSSWQLGDRSRYLECMYSLFAGALSQQTYISCEHRHGIQGTLFATPLAFYLARLAVIDEHIEPGVLHLLRFCPLAWIIPKQETVFDNMPTEFGPMSLRLRLSDDRRVMYIFFSEEFREHPRRIVLHVPQITELCQIIINGRKHKIRSGQTSIIL